MPRKKYQYTIRSVLGSILFLVFTVVYGVYFSLYQVVSICNYRYFSDFMPPILRFWAKGFFLLTGIKLYIEGKEKLLDRAPRIVVLNHQSALDIIWPAFILSPGAFAVGKKELMYIPILNFAWFMARCVFIDRQNKDRAMKTMFKVGNRIVQEKASLFIAPEGTRSKTGEILPFKKGAFRLAAEHSIPIYPVVVSGAYEALPPHHVFAKQGLIKVKCLEPVDTTNWDVQTVLLHMEEVRSKMLEAYENLKNQL